MGLSFRVRDGTGRFPHAMTAVTLLPVPQPGLGWEALWLQLVLLPVEGRGGVVIQLFGSQATGLLVGNHIVDASSLVSFYHCGCERLLNPFTQWCVV